MDAKLIAEIVCINIVAWVLCDIFEQAGIK
jgi:hypothetical protein